MCDNTHEIVFKNVTTGDRITTALILIHGHIGNPCETSQLTITSNQNKTHHFHSMGHFKCLLALSVGSNDYTLTYCNTSTVLRIDHVPNSSEYQVIPLYVICKNHDGHFQSPHSDPAASPAVACRRIDVMLQLVQLVYAEKLREAQFGRSQSFRIGESCRPYFSDLQLDRALDMTEQELWDHLANEIIRTEGAKRVATRKYVAILGCTRFEGISNGDYSYETIKRRTKARAAIGGGGLVVFNTGCLYTWPDEVEEVQLAFQNVKRVDMEHFADDSNYRRTFGGCFATNLGSLCHECGHVFDLGHTEEGVMGRSFDATEKLFLASSCVVNSKMLPKRATPGNGAHVEMSAAGAGSSARVTRVRMNGSVLRDYLKERECNGIYFTRNCLAILATHKWFRNEREVEVAAEVSPDNESSSCQVVSDATNLTQSKVENEDLRKEKPLLWFCATTRMVKSVYAMRLVELRELGSEMVKDVWESKEEERKTEFKLPQTHYSIISRPCILFAIDCQGNTLKCEI